MRPPAHSPADVVFNGSDEQAMTFLDMLRNKFPLPNIVTELNPYQYKPCNLPAGMWYLVCATEKEKADFGFWRQNEASSEIFTNSSVRGWRTTLEFMEIQGAREQRTDWVMQEYKLTEKGSSGARKDKESRAICRVFHSTGRSSNLEMHPNARDAASFHRNNVGSLASDVPSSDTRSKPCSTSTFQVNNKGDDKELVSEAGRHMDPQMRDTSELQYILEGDFLELDDLADPQSRSTLSDNSSGRFSFTMDEYFDSYALLQELDDKSSETPQGKNSNSRFSVTASVKPFEVVMQPATLGSLVCAGGKQPTVGDRVADDTVNKLIKAEKRNKGSSSSLGVASSLNIGKGKEKAAGSKRDSIKKYCCFIAF